MTRTTYNHESLRRHGISIGDVDEVLAQAIWIEIEPSKRGHDRLMFVGFTAEGRLLEVGVEYLDEDIEHIFHADDASELCRSEFVDRTGK